MNRKSFHFINIILCIFIFLAIVIFFLKVDPSLWYYNKQPFFIKGQLLNSLLDMPGSFSNVFSCFLGQYFYNKYIAVFILSCILLMWYCLWGLLLRNYFSFFKIVTLISITVLPIIISASVYNYPFTFTVSYFFALVLAFCFNSLITRRKLVMAILILFFSFITYFLLSSSGLIFFIFVVSGILLLKKKYLYISTLILIGISIPLLFFVLGFNMTLKQAYFGNFLITNYESILKVVYFMPLLSFIVLLILYIFYLKQSWFEKIFTFYPVHTGAMFCIIILFLVKSFNAEEKLKIEINKFADNRDWRILLNRASDELYSDPIVQFQINRALYHQGVLLEKLFQYPQLFGTDALLLERLSSGTIAMPTSDIYYEIGYLNESRHWANEAYQIFGNSSRILTRLTNTFIAASEYKVAEKYLNILRGSRISKKYVDDVEKYLYCDECLLSNPEFQNLRIMSPEDDFFASVSNPGYNLKRLIMNKKNKMAFEYYAAYCMLSHNLGEVVNILKDFREKGYLKLPRSIQETLLLYIAMTGNSNFDLGGYEIDKLVYEDFKSFSEIKAMYGRDLARAKKELLKYDNTYWYYILYNSPITTGNLLKAK